MATQRISPVTHVPGEWHASRIWFKYPDVIPCAKEDVRSERAFFTRGGDEDARSRSITWASTRRRPSHRWGWASSWELQARTVSVLEALAGHFASGRTPLRWWVFSFRFYITSCHFRPKTRHQKVTSFLSISCQFLVTLLSNSFIRLVQLWIESCINSCDKPLRSSMVDNSSEVYWLVMSSIKGNSLAPTASSSTYGS